MIVPNTEIKLLKVPFELDNKNQLTFLNLEAQTNFFENLQGLEIENSSYQRKNNVIRAPYHYDEIQEYNYCMYKNENYSDKWFYAFITDMQYINDNMTEITIKTDVFQTWQFDIIYKKSFVEREHVNSDNVGEHTVDENLNLGEYVINQVDSFDMGDMCYVIQCTEWTNSSLSKPLATNYGGIFYAGGAYICDTLTEVVNILEAYAHATHTTAEAVYSLYMIPKKFVLNTSDTLQYSGQSTPAYFEKDITKPSSLNNYTPVNKKLLTFPYCYLNVANNNGTTNSLQYEHFNEIEENPNSCIFNIKGVPVIGGSIKCVPFNYKTNSELNNEEEGILAGKFPTLNWSEDAFTNWLTQNGVNIAFGTATNIATIIGGLGLMSLSSATRCCRSRLCLFWSNGNCTNSCTN